MLPTQLTNMHILMLLSMMMMIGALMAAAQPHCDPLTQNEKDGECCNKCGPGTRMTSLGTCLEPQCSDCGENEYQDKYTDELSCQRQPYCDPHKNFKLPITKNKKEKISCMCKNGFHCSSEECITCVPHTTCEPGHGAKIIGTHAHDTVCQKCEIGTFSDDTSWDGVCKEWTQCKDGYHVQQSGTDTSDNICERPPRKHILVICLVISVILILLALGITYWRCQGDASQKVKLCVESCMGENEKKPLRETHVPIMQTDNPTEEESLYPQSLPEEGGAGPPEENEHEPHQEVSAVGLTELGNVVAEEIGKSAIVSRQESQTETFTD